MFIYLEYFTLFRLFNVLLLHKLPGVSPWDRSGSTIEPREKPLEKDECVAFIGEPKGQQILGNRRVRFKTNNQIHLVLSIS